MTREDLHSVDVGCREIVVTVRVCIAADGSFAVTRPEVSEGVSTLWLMGVLACAQYELMVLECRP